MDATAAPWNEGENMASLDKVYVSSSALRRELGVASNTVQSILSELGPDNVLTFEGRTLYRRAAIAVVVRKRHAKVLNFLSASEGGE